MLTNYEIKQKIIDGIPSNQQNLKPQELIAIIIDAVDIILDAVDDKIQEVK